MLIQIPLRWSHVFSFAAGFMVACMVAAFFPDGIPGIIGGISAHCPWVEPIFLGSSSGGEGTGGAAISDTTKNAPCK